MNRGTLTTFAVSTVAALVAASSVALAAGQKAGAATVFTIEQAAAGKKAYAQRAARRATCRT